MTHWGRGEVADLLGRFQKIDGTKAETLRREIHKASLISTKWLGNVWRLCGALRV